MFYLQHFIKYNKAKDCGEEQLISTLALRQSQRNSNIQNERMHGLFLSKWLLCLKIETQKRGCDQWSNSRVQALIQVC